MERDFLPTASVEMLHRRAQLLSRIRNFFADDGFVEVQTPCLSADTVVDVYLDPPRLASQELRLNAENLPAEFFLQTSPEYAMKRLLVGGMQAIYQIAPAFRAGERGTWHNPEFTMLEWYRVGDSADDAIAFLHRFALEILPFDQCRRLSYRELFLEYVQWDPLDIATRDLQTWVADVDASVAESLGDERDGLLDWVLAAVIQPRTRSENPLIVTHYPISQAALARSSPDQPGTAERFELFARGIELANGYGELLDPDILLQRSEQHQRKRQKLGKSHLPTNSRLLAAMRHGLPACAGVAMGVDRLLMVAERCDDITEVIPFPIERA